MIQRNRIIFGAHAAQATVQRFGITGIFMPPLLHLIVNTSNASVFALRCEGVVVDNRGVITGENETDIHLTIYGKCLINNVLWQYD